jgi:hypothetical protein
MSTLKNQIIQQKILNFLTKKSHLQQFISSKLDGLQMDKSLSIDNKKDKKFLVSQSESNYPLSFESLQSNLPNTTSSIDGLETLSPIHSIDKSTLSIHDSRHSIQSIKSIKSVDPLYPFLLIFHVNTVKVKQLIYLRKLLYSKNIKSPCIKIPIRYLLKCYQLEDSDRIDSVELDSFDQSKMRSIQFKNDFLNNVSVIGGSSYIFFCSKIIDVQQILQIINESKNLVTSFIHIGLIIQKLPRSPEWMNHFVKQPSIECLASGPQTKLSIESRQLIYPFGTYNFLSIYDTLSFIELKSNLFQKIINFLENNKLLSIKISNISNIIVQLLLMNRIIWIQMIQKSVNS